MPLFVVSMGDEKRDEGKGDISLAPVLGRVSVERLARFMSDDLR